MDGWFEVRELTSFLVGRLSEMGVRQGRAGLRPTGVVRCAGEFVGGGLRGIAWRGWRGGWWPFYIHT